MVKESSGRRVVEGCETDYEPYYPLRKKKTIINTSRVLLFVRGFNLNWVGCIKFMDTKVIHIYLRLRCHLSKDRSFSQMEDLVLFFVDMTSILHSLRCCFFLL